MSRLPALAAAGAVVTLVACGGAGGGDPSAPGDAARGRQLFEAHCARCHGLQAVGGPTGPPLVHELYVPGHHADEAFQLAVDRGVQPHHWGFGPMPPVGNVSSGEVTDIVAYVRQLQRDAGLID